MSLAVRPWSALGSRAGPNRQQEAERFLEQMRERLADYGLGLHPEKTRLIQCGRFAAEDRKRDGAGKPETFHFLGFTHICGTIWKSGKFTVVRKTVGKRLTAKLRSIAGGLRRRRNDPIEQTRWCGDTTITRYREICGVSTRSGGKQRGTGCSRCGGAAKRSAGWPHCR